MTIPPAIGFEVQAPELGGASSALAGIHDGESIVSCELAADVRQMVPGHATAMTAQDPTP